MTTQINANNDVRSNTIMGYIIQPNTYPNVLLFDTTLDSFDENRVIIIITQSAHQLIVSFRFRFYYVIVFNLKSLFDCSPI
jgi:hypothetical protein